MTDEEAAETCERWANSRDGDIAYARERGIPVPNLEAFRDVHRQAAHALRVKGMLVEALEELVGLMEGARSGDYTPDALTCQPARLAIAEARKVTP